VAAIAHYILRKKIPNWKKNIYHRWLNLLLFGGAIFGVVDHWWNRELFLIGEKPILDLMLGFTITIVILITWTIIVVIDKIKTYDLSENAN
jgi:hypothetical protein